jgi:hypothetical protein
MVICMLDTFERAVALALWHGDPETAIETLKKNLAICDPTMASLYDVGGSTNENLISIECPIDVANSGYALYIFYLLPCDYAIRIRAVAFFGGNVYRWIQ